MNCIVYCLASQQTMSTTSLHNFTTAIFLFLVFVFVFSRAQLPNNTDFTQSPGAPLSCDTYLTYRASSLYSDIGAISDLFGISRMSVVTANRLGSEDAKLVQDQLLLIPIKCTSNGSQYYFSNVMHEIKKLDTFYSISTRDFQNLTNYNLVEDINPTLNPNNLTVGMHVKFPLLCKCPGKSQAQKGMLYLITYVWQPADDVVHVSTTFQALPEDVVAENNGRNFTDAVCLPVLIPVASAALIQQLPSRGTKSKHRYVLIAVLSGIVACLIAFTGLIVVMFKRKKALVHKVSVFECPGFIPTKIMQGKLLPGLSDYLGKPVVYDLNTIAKGTSNFSNRIGRLFYKAVIDDQTFVVKKTRNATEELQILQRVNHGNLVKLMGVSLDNDGNYYMVYEFVENGSLARHLLHEAVASSQPLTWKQRLLIALDVANGLQYLHEHTEPSIVHKAIMTSNILLDSNFKAKIANFSSTRAATCPTMLKVDIFSFGIVLLELLSGKRGVEIKDDGEKMTLPKEVNSILDVNDSRREERLRKWIDPYLGDAYCVDDALSLAMLARACTLEDCAERPTTAEVVFSLSVITQASPQASWGFKFESGEVLGVSNAVIAR